MQNCKDPSAVKVVKEELAFKGNWLSLKNLTYRDGCGKDRIWEAVSRTTHRNGIADGVGIIPILKRSQMSDCLVCIKQFRPPMRTATLEFPAGLLDAGETPQQAALRELKEETGYTAKAIKSFSNALSLDAGTEDSTMHIVCVEIDGDDPVNIAAKPTPDETEFIEVMVIPKSDFLGKVNEIAATGVVVDSRLYMYALGITSAAQTHTANITVR